MANAASATIEMSVVCLLRRLSTADPEEMLPLPKDHLVDVPLSTPVREVAAEVFLRTTTLRSTQRHPDLRSHVNTYSGVLTKAVASLPLARRV